MLKRLLLAVWLLLPWMATMAGHRINVHSISRREGLSNGAVNTIAMDAEGYVWLGTWNGLNRYDGSHIVTYLPGSKPYAIHNHVVRELYPTTEGPIWMLTNRGVGFYDNATNRFHSFFTNESEQINYENDISLSITADQEIYAAVYRNGVFRYNRNTCQYDKIDFSAGSYLASLEIKRLLSIANTVYCITGSDQLMEIRGNELREILHIPIESSIIASLGVMIQDCPHILIAQHGGDAIIIDINQKSATPVSIPGDIITAFAPSSQTGRLWAGTEKGIIYSIHASVSKFEIANSLSDQFVKNPIEARVLTIYESSPDILWIGTDGNGAYNLKLSEFPNKSLPADQLSYPIVRSILVTRDKNLLIGTKGGGIDIFNPDGIHIRNITINDGLDNNSVLAMKERTDGTIWVGTDGRGIEIISPDFETIKNFPGDYIDTPQPEFASVYRILETNDGRLYLGTSGYGVISVEFDHNAPSVPVFYEQVILDQSTSGSGRQRQIVYALTEEKPGIIWIGTRGNGICQYNTVTKRVMTQMSSSTHPQVMNDDILALFTDHENRIWVGSSAGIFSIITESGIPEIFTDTDLPWSFKEASIHSIQTDLSGNIWITTNNGLSCIDLDNQTVKNFNADDGLINFEYSDGASFFDRSSGQLYVGGTMGVDMIRTREIKFASYFPPVAINNIFIRNQAVEVSEESVLTSRINLQSELVLNNNQNALTFWVSPLVYWGKERHKISYRLKNFDDGWVNHLHNQAINFTNLSPGRYYLQLRVSDENGIWSDQIKQVGIVIHPPIWKTAWAIAGYVMIFIGIQLLIIRWYRRREWRKKELALMEFRQQKDKELQNYKIEFFTNLAHEFKAPLTLITSHIHAMMEESETTGTNPRLQKVYNNSIKLQKLVYEIIQFRRLEKGKEPLDISRANPEALAREVVADLQWLAQKREISCEVSCNENRALCHHRCRQVPAQYLLISFPMPLNTTEPGGYVKVRINVYEQVTSPLKVEDNGIGIDPEFKNKLFEPFNVFPAKNTGAGGYKSTGLGLAVTKGIMDLLKGSVTFESRPDKGSIFSCRFPNMHPDAPAGLIRETTEKEDILEYLDEVTPSEPVAPSEISPEKPTLLLVDDEPDILLLLNDLLSQNYNLYFAKNGFEALHLLEKHPIELIVSDILMPVMDGIEFCNKVRNNFDTSHLPLICSPPKPKLKTA
jgi:ligand-binding sensor domain-containing protein/signal transduction histidine kinase